MVSRRGFLSYGTVSLTSALTGRWTWAREGEPRARTLEDVVPGRTVDLEVHISDAELYAGRELPDTREVTEEAVETAMQRMRFSESMPGYDESRARFVEYRSRTSIDLRAEFLFAELDEAGIDLAVHQMVDHTVAPSSIGRHYEASFDRMMEDAVRVRERYRGRLLTMVGIDPRSGPADATIRFEAAIRDYGCKGLGEVVLQQFEIFPHDSRLYPLYEKCVEHRVPFVGNCEGPSPYTMPREFEQVARDFPELRICLAGAGRPRRESLETSAIDDALALANEYENVYLDTADWQRRDAEGIRLFLSFLRRCFDSDARTKIMYGSDYPVFVAMYHPRDWIDVLLNQAGHHGFELSDTEIAAFFSTNALGFLEDVL